MISNTENSKSSSTQLELQELIQEKDRLVSEGKYLEAEELKQKISELREDSECAKTKTLFDNQEQENNNLEEAFNNDLESLVNEWDAQINLFIQQGKQSQEDLNERHNQEMDEYINKLTANYPPIKYSREYLEKKNIELNYAKMEKYKEAQYYRNICNRLEKKELEKYLKERNDIIQRKAEKLGMKQTMEKKVLQGKLDLKYELLIRKKDKDLQQCALKYRNMKSEMDYLHKQQKNAEKDLSKTQKCRNGLNRLNNLINLNKSNKTLNVSKVSKNSRSSKNNAMNSGKYSNKGNNGKMNNRINYNSNNYQIGGGNNHKIPSPNSAGIKGNNKINKQNIGQKQHMGRSNNEYNEDEEEYENNNEEYNDNEEDGGVNNNLNNNVAGLNNNVGMADIQEGDDENNQDNYGSNSEGNNYYEGEEGEGDGEEYDGREEDGDQGEEGEDDGQ